jgi:hypothetical protein
MDWHGDKFYVGKLWQFMLRPRFYRRWDFGRCRGICVDWLWFTVQYRTDIKF